MQTLLKIVGILIILFFLAFGIVALLNPTALMILPAFAWSPDGIAGLSAGRGIIASHFLTLGLLAGLPHRWPRGACLVVADGRLYVVNPPKGPSKHHGRNRQYQAYDLPASLQFQQTVLLRTTYRLNPIRQLFP